MYGEANFNYLVLKLLYGTRVQYCGVGVILYLVLYSWKTSIQYSIQRAIPIPLLNICIQKSIIHNNRHIDYRLVILLATSVLLCEDCFCVAERSEQKPGLTTKLVGTTRETLQEYRLQRHGRTWYWHSIKETSSTYLRIRDTCWSKGKKKRIHNRPVSVA